MLRMLMRSGMWCVVVAANRSAAPDRQITSANRIDLFLRTNASSCSIPLRRPSAPIRFFEPMLCFRQGSTAMKVAILDDYQNAALSIADWSGVSERAEITVFTDHLVDAAAVVERLLPFDVVCVMRERTPLSRAVIERLPRLKLIASTGPFNSSIDTAAAEERGISVTGTGYKSVSTIEMTWALILASVRHLVRESNSIRAGGWQTSIGQELEGRGGQVARIGLAFGMKVIASSQNLTPEAATTATAAR